MADEVLYSLGIDVSSDFSFHDGDIVLAKYDQNLLQGIVNRLNTDLDELDLFYIDYGSIFTSFFGWRANDVTISFMKSELGTILDNEPRLANWETEITYTGEGKVKVELKLYPVNATERIEAVLELNENGVEVITDGT